MGNTGTPYRLYLADTHKGHVAEVCVASCTYMPPALEKGFSGARTELSVGPIKNTTWLPQLCSCNAGDTTVQVSKNGRSDDLHDAPLAQTTAKAPKCAETAPLVV